jgi:hypothetical protein
MRGILATSETEGCHDDGPHGARGMTRPLARQLRSWKRVTARSGHGPPDDGIRSAAIAPPGRSVGHVDDPPPPTTCCPDNGTPAGRDFLPPSPSTGPYGPRKRPWAAEAQGRLPFPPGRDQGTHDLLGGAQPSRRRPGRHDEFVMRVAPPRRSGPRQRPRAFAGAVCDARGMF